MLALFEALSGRAASRAPPACVCARARRDVLRGGYPRLCLSAGQYSKDEVREIAVHVLGMQKQVCARGGGGADCACPR